ncbi:MAG: DUF4013 domain-containing protein [Nanoarchaeota archaeon]|nr:DUF4013 domain-containing protein [Nanoarchaeota archaeon]MBU1622761.1 DUF4013 domain-containing protein [Nanoarchaeota archaeon]MBU1973921.1 DUF4013 domain-containing protein [Nanoarchaeota archaeon]
MPAKKTPLNFKSAFKYPFNRAKGMWNILWIFLPIIGWFALGGYGIRIVKEFCKGKFKQLPTFSFSSDLKLGFFMFLKSLPFILAYSVVLMILSLISLWLRGAVQLLFSLFVMPILFIHFFNKETVGSLFEFKIVKPVFTNLGDYIVILLKSILLALIFLVMIIILVGIPAGSFTKNIFFADFYRRRVK